MKSQNNISANIEMQIKKLVILLHNSNMPQKIKESLIVLLPEMSLGQIERLINILEAKFLDEQTKKVDNKYKKKINKIFNDFAKNEIKVDGDFIKALDKFEKNLKA